MSSGLKIILAPLQTQIRSFLLLQWEFKFSNPTRDLNLFLYFYFSIFHCLKLLFIKLFFNFIRKNWMYRGLTSREYGIRYSIQHCILDCYTYCTDGGLPIPSWNIVLPKVECVVEVPCGLFWDFSMIEILFCFRVLVFLKSEKTRDVMNLTLLMLAHAPWLFSLALK